MASPGALWGRLGRQGAPKRGSGSKTLVRWTPPQTGTISKKSITWKFKPELETDWPVCF